MRAQRVSVPPPGHPPKRWLIRLLSAQVRQQHENPESAVDGLGARSCTSSLALWDGKATFLLRLGLLIDPISVTSIVAEPLRDTNGLWGEPRRHYFSVVVAMAADILSY